MTISYKWLSEYLPFTVEPEKLSRILTGLGLEVESFSKYEEAKGGLKGLLIGEVLSVRRHPNADKLTLTEVRVGNGDPLRIVCGAPNVAVGQKVVVAPAGATIYPVNGDPLTMERAVIRGEESQGMICAEDEIGLGTSHEGIMVLDATATVGSSAASYFQPYEDWIYEIGLTPNRMDAMSHWGVARDVCAWFSYHEKQHVSPQLPSVTGFKPDNVQLPFRVAVENPAGCPRYSGVSISKLRIGPSPKWLQQKLKAIGLRPINNIVDITNFIQHETGQPLHAFDADKISDRSVIIKNLPGGTPFTTLDQKERKLSPEDLMICDPGGGLCIAGVFGGIHSGVTGETTNIFLESACFDPVSIRKTSFRHGLRTDAAMRFEKGTDISATVPVLKRAALLIREICGGEISSDIVDVYPDPVPRTELGIKYHYLRKLSGKIYHPETVKNILGSLGFETVKETVDELWVSVPYGKRDISLPADIVEEVLRVDGLDNIEIPASVTITPAIGEHDAADMLREKISNYLAGIGFSEIVTNSITSSRYFAGAESESLVRMKNSLSAGLDVLRPSLFETSLEVVAHNMNHQNRDLLLFEFGKAYRYEGKAKYSETETLALVVTGEIAQGWRRKSAPADFYYLKGVVHAILNQLGVRPDSVEPMNVPKLVNHVVARLNGEVVAGFGEVNPPVLETFDIGQPVFFGGLNWDLLVRAAGKQSLSTNELPRFPAVHRDIAMIVARDLLFRHVEEAVNNLKMPRLQAVKLFDIFESEKLGKGKKSMALSFTFQDMEKTLTDREVDEMMQRLMTTLEKNVKAEIRKG
ncbi:MAG TPA: phenylalanine--tRNA ligase subunit beta [Chitinophagaceae bacterium]|nr:phenylalanine--tRNA ligase subunit beta [Chitinophagaceae bacterium]